LKRLKIATHTVDGTVWAFHVTERAVLPLPCYTVCWLTWPGNPAALFTVSTLGRSIC